jgi:HSP20 family protein
MNDVFENPHESLVRASGPHFYGYEISVGTDGRPRLREWGNARLTNAIEESGYRQLFVDETLNEKEKILTLVTETPGIEKADIKVNIENNTVTISAERGNRKY